MWVKNKYILPREAKLGRKGKSILNFEPTLRSERRECLHSLPSREEETRVYLS